jgi:hypothetical protein
MREEYIHKCPNGDQLKTSLGESVSPDGDNEK